MIPVCLLFFRGTLIVGTCSWGSPLAPWSQPGFLVKT